MKKEDSFKLTRIQKEVLSILEKSAEARLHRSAKMFQTSEMLSHSDVLRNKHQIQILCTDKLDMLTRWSDCGLSKKILDRIPFKDMKPVQMQVIPYILAERSVCVLSETGSGKTLAFVLPYAHMLSSVDVLLIIVPTRELASQVHAEFQKYLVSSVLITGGDAFEKQRSCMQASRVIVSTMGRLVEHLSFRTIDIRCIRYLVVDEMDRILADGFEDDFVRIWKSMSLKATQLFSATASSRIAKVGIRATIVVGRVGAINPNVNLEFLEAGAKHEMLSVLMSRYREKSKVMMVFCNSASTCEHLSTLFPFLTVLHGKKPADYRKKVMEMVQKGRVRYIACTDVAGRGLDIEGVDLVVNYDLPKDIETFIHRAGRTGRKTPGCCVSFVGKDDASIRRDLVALSLECNFAIPEFMRKRSTEIRR